MFNKPVICSDDWERALNFVCKIPPRKFGLNLRSYQVRHFMACFKTWMHCEWFFIHRKWIRSCLTLPWFVFLIAAFLASLRSKIASRLIWASVTNIQPWKVEYFLHERNKWLNRAKDCKLFEWYIDRGTWNLIGHNLPDASPNLSVLSFRQVQCLKH